MNTEEKRYIFECLKDLSIIIGDLKDKIEELAYSFDLEEDN